MNEMGKFLMIAGLLLVAVGALLWSGFGKGWLGRLPGDIIYSKGDFSFHFPLMTCLILSALLTLLLWLFRRQKQGISGRTPFARTPFLA
jgi:membrane protein implicated in regulation of membrane protease activity